MRLRGVVASASTIFALRSCAVCASSVMSAASAEEIAHRHVHGAHGHQH